MPDTAFYNKKLGPLKVWNWAAIGVGVGGLLYLYSAHKSSSGQELLNPEEEEKLLSALNLSRGAGGESGVPGSPIATGAEGAIGAPGPQGEPGPTGANPSEGLERDIGALEARTVALERASAPGKPGLHKPKKPARKVFPNSEWNRTHPHHKRTAGQEKRAQKHATKHTRATHKAPAAHHAQHSHRVAPVHHTAPVPLKHRVHAAPSPHPRRRRHR